MTTWSGYRARWRGADYAATVDPQPNQLWVRLRSAEQAPGFEEIEPQVFARQVTAEECDAVLFVSTVCEWRSAEFHVHDERDDDLLLEYVGGLLPVAQRLELERVERGVYRRWVPRAEVRAMREKQVPITS